jgi:hypothetical protein
MEKLFFIILFSILSTIIETKYNYISRLHETKEEEKLQWIIEQPVDQQALIGDQVLIKCTIKNLSGEPQWCIDDFCLGLSKKVEGQETIYYLKGRSRYKIIGDKSKGEFHLLIQPVDLQDNMYFYCMATAASQKVQAVKSNRVFLTVLSNNLLLFF